MATHVQHRTAAAHWRADFERHAGRHRDVIVAGIEPPPAWPALGPSLAVFQLGETGSGSKLFAAARRIGCDHDQVAALELFIGEEQEHARLLSMVLSELDTPLASAHWTDRVFVLARQAFGYRGEVLMLLVAEVVALAYYSTLRDGMDDDRLRDLFARIHADEVRHVRFHADTLPPLLCRWPSWQWWAGRGIWNLVVAGTSVVVGIGHRHALRGARSSARRLIVTVNRLRIDQDAHLFTRSRPT